MMAFWDWLTKALDAMRHPRLQSGGWGGPWQWAGSTAPYTVDTAAVGDGSLASVVMAPVRWAMRNYAEAPLQVVQQDRDGTRTPLVGHPCATLLEQPNPAYSGPQLWMAVIADAMLSGNGYLAKVRAGSGRVVELWWVPSALITPRGSDSDPTVWIDHYDYTPQGAPIALAPADVIHLRPFGLDPQQPRLGWSPLLPLLREVATDLEAGAFTAAVLRNLGVPGVIVSPSGDQAMDPDSAEWAKRVFEQKFGGENRGRALVALRGLKVDVVSWSPQQLDLKNAARRVPEERVSAVYGIPAVVSGLGSGWEHSTYNNVAEAREAAYEEFLIPVQRLNASTLTTQLLPDFAPRPGQSLAYDYSQVRVLQEDRSALYAREAQALAAGGITLDEYRSAIGRPPVPTGRGNVFYLGGQTQVIPAAQLAGVAPVARTAGLPPTKAAPALGVFHDGVLELADALADAADLAPFLDAVAPTANGTHGTH